MQMTECVLGIDTSNYKTSAALVDLSGRIIADSRELLKVKKGERGLRQSEALFQHVENLPRILDEVYRATEGAEVVKDAFEIRAVCASVKPRPAEGSYMPCFNAGRTAGRVIARALSVPYFETSHQEGHIAAIEGSLGFELPQDFLSLHLSGGTCELLKVHRARTGYDIEIVGGSKDISFGQVIDRVGVALGMEFPSGVFMDEMALKASKLTYKPLLTGVRVSESWFNLSGLETQAQRAVENSGSASGFDSYALILELFDRITACTEKMIEQAKKAYGLKTVLFAGGVSSSRYISEKLMRYSKDMGYEFYFGDQSLSSDNAVGTARIGARLFNL